MASTTLTVLTDDDVQKLLHSLSREDVIALQLALAEALHTYSTGTNDQGACAANQPLRTSITKRNATTLFMPASTGDMTGMKMVTLTESNKSSASRSASETSSLNQGAGTNSSKTSLATTGASSNSNLSIRSASSNKDRASSPARSKTPTTPTSPSTASAPASAAALPAQGTTPRGLLTLLTQTGAPLGLMAAEELTAFRTALAATMLLKRREHVSTITVFGAGKQAYWHIRLALILRGEDIHRVNIINRSFARTEPLLRSFYGPSKAGEWRPPSTTKLSVLSQEYGEYDRLLKDNVRKADIIFCCTPSTSPLFPAEILTSHEGRRKGRYLSAIGSYKPHMCEIHPDILRQAVATPHHGHHYHKHAPTSGVVIVDSLTACLKEAGELIQAGITPAQVVEIGELVMLRRQELKERADGSVTGQGPVEGVSEKAKSKGGLEEWLMKGNVIYKSVGMGLMDLVVGGELVRLAAEKNVGTRINGF
ncbi:MAG: Cytoplasmic thioredoxin isoenzyme 2 [Chaenotheca gracillima]|nr:MAG: Cytoplasmic thioredoxin isoenzyme 2 [Chaenotheca gracillima]